MKTKEIKNTSVNNTIEILTNLDYYLIEKNPLAHKKAFLATPESVINYLGSLYGSEISLRQIHKILKGIENSGKGTPTIIPLELREKVEGAYTWFALSNGDAFCVSDTKENYLASFFHPEEDTWIEYRTLCYVRGGVSVLAKKAAEYAAKKAKSDKLSKESNIPSYILEVFGPEWGEDLEKMTVRFADDERRWVKSDLTNFFDFRAVPWVHRRRALELVKGAAFTSKRAKRHFCRIIKTADSAVSWNIAGWLWHEKCCDH